MAQIPDFMRLPVAADVRRRISRQNRTLLLLLTSAATGLTAHRIHRRPAPLKNKKKGGVTLRRAINRPPLRGLRGCPDKKTNAGPRNMWVMTSLPKERERGNIEKPSFSVRWRIAYWKTRR